MAIGTDQVSNTLAVTRDQLLSAPSGISGLKMLENLPGFNVQTDGALGLYEFGNSVSVRAFNLSQMGFVLDGIPMGRSDAFGGSPIFRYVDNENLRSVTASPGAGDVSKPSYATLGPVASYVTTMPSHKAGGMVSMTMGDDDLRRSFVKLQTGDIGGFRAYLSRSKTDSNLWRGPGSINREHIEGKAIYEFTDSYLQATYVYNDFYDYDSPTATKATFDKNYNYGYSATLPDGCISADPQVYDFNGDGSIDSNDFIPVFTGSNCTSYYKDRVNARHDKLYSLTYGTALTTDLSFKATGYYEDKIGYGISPDSYSNSLSIYQEEADAGLDVVHPRGVQYGYSGLDGDRKGITLGFDWYLGEHHLAFGTWYEDDKYHRMQLRYNHENGSADGAVLWDEVVYYRRNYHSERKTHQYYLKDTLGLMNDRLKLELGVKALDMDYSLNGYRDYDDYYIDGGSGYGPQSISANYQDFFLPMVGAVYTLNSTDQLFASYAENYALPAGADDIFSTAVETVVKPEAEEANNYELGYRTNRDTFNTSIALYYTLFKNRLVEGNVLNPATDQPESFYVNAGDSEAYGVELSGVWQPAIFKKKLYFNSNVTFNHATLKDGFDDNPAGSRLADSPLWLFNGGVTWEPSDWLVAHFSAKYTGSRYGDYAEDYKTAAYWTTSAYVDIGGPNNFGLPENVSIRFNLDNVFNTKAMAYIYSGSNYVRPLSPRTFQATLTVHF
nr:TonB-dependent receptor [Gallaecimonas mangrovi]